MKKKRFEIPAVITETVDKPIHSEVYVEIDTDLARDNLENDLPEADKQDL